MKLEDCLLLISTKDTQGLKMLEIVFLKNKSNTTNENEHPWL